MLSYQAAPPTCILLGPLNTTQQHQGEGTEKVTLALKVCDRPEGKDGSSEATVDKQLIVFRETKETGRVDHSAS